MVIKSNIKFAIVVINYFAKNLFYYYKKVFQIVIYYLKVI